MPEATTFHPISEQVGGQPVQGTRIEFQHVQPPMTVDVFPNRLQVVQAGIQTHELNGPTGYRWGGRKLLVNGRSEDGHSRLLVNQKGIVLFAHDPSEPITPDRARKFAPWQPTEEEFGFTERYPRLDVTDPSTFDNVGYGDVVRFTRTELGLTQQQLAGELYVSLSTIIRLEQGKIPKWFQIGEKGTPLYDIQRESCRKAIEASRR